MANEDAVYGIGPLSSTGAARLDQKLLDKPFTTTPVSGENHHVILFAKDNPVLSTLARHRNNRFSPSIAVSVNPSAYGLDKHGLGNLLEEHWNVSSDSREQCPSIGDKTCP